MENIYCGDKDDAPCEPIRYKETIAMTCGMKSVRREILWNGRPLPRRAPPNGSASSDSSEQEQPPIQFDPASAARKELYCRTCLN
jgi:hypothetical protein